MSCRKPHFQINLQEDQKASLRPPEPVVVRDTDFIREALSAAGVTATLGCAMRPVRIDRIGDGVAPATSIIADAGVKMALLVSADGSEIFGKIGAQIVGDNRRSAGVLFNAVTRLLDQHCAKLKPRGMIAGLASSRARVPHRCELAA